MLLIYPAIVHQDEDGMWAEFPDLEGCQTVGDTYEEILANAGEALECYTLSYLEDGISLPKPSDPSEVVVDGKGFVTLVAKDINLAKNAKSVKKTLTIPAWLNDKATAAGINFSKVLQEALIDAIG